MLHFLTSFAKISRAAIFLCPFSTDIEPRNHKFFQAVVDLDCGSCQDSQSSWHDLVLVVVFGEPFILIEMSIVALTLIINKSRPFLLEKETSTSVAKEAS